MSDILTQQFFSHDSQNNVQILVIKDRVLYMFELLIKDECMFKLLFKIYIIILFIHII